MADRFDEMAREWADGTIWEGMDPELAALFRRVHNEAVEAAAFVYIVNQSLMATGRTIDEIRALKIGVAKDAARKEMGG